MPSVYAVLGETGWGYCDDDKYYIETIATTPEKAREIIKEWDQSYTYRPMFSYTGTKVYENDEGNTLYVRKIELDTKIDS